MCHGTFLSYSQFYFFILYTQLELPDDKRHDDLRQIIIKIVYIHREY